MELHDPAPEDPVPPEPLESMAEPELRGTGETVGEGKTPERRELGGKPRRDARRRAMLPDPPDQDEPELPFPPCDEVDRPWPARRPDDRKAVSLEGLPGEGPSSGHRRASPSPVLNSFLNLTPRRPAVPPGVLFGAMDLKGRPRARESEPGP